MTKLIALEEHFLTPAIRAAWAQSPAAADYLRHADRPEQALVESRLMELGPGRLALMDESGVDVQVLSLTTPGLVPLTAESSLALARQTNDLLATTIARHPTRFEGLATLPLPDPEAAADELARGVQQLGLAGAMLYGRVGERPLDDPAFRPLWARAAALRVPLYLHPQLPPPPVRAAYYQGLGETVDAAFASFGLGWHYEAGISFVRLVLAGVLDEYPGLQLILGHWGEVVLFYLERLEGLARVAGLPRPLTEYVRQHLYVTPSGMWSPAYLQRTLEVVGPERLLFSADYPYQYRPGRQARQFVEQAALLAREKELFAHGNWERLTRAIQR